MLRTVGESEGGGGVQSSKKRKAGRGVCDAVKLVVVTGGRRSSVSVWHARYDITRRNVLRQAVSAGAAVSTLPSTPRV